MTPDTPKSTHPADTSISEPRIDMAPEVAMPEPLLHIALEDWQDGLRDADITSTVDRGDTTPLYSADQLRTALAERDAALERVEFCLAMTRDAQDVAARANELMTAAAAERDALRQELEALRPVLAFLNGTATLDGVWFGDPHPTGRGLYWWREHLRARPVRASAGPAETQGWISVNDPRKPRGREVILVAVEWLKRGEHEDGTPYESTGVDVTEGEWVPPHGEAGGYFESFQGSHGDSSGVTHWRSLPPPPGASPQSAPAREGRQPLTEARINALASASEVGRRSLRMPVGKIPRHLARLPYEVFTQEGDFAAARAAESWCAARGVSVGRMERGAARGLLYGDFDIQKWHNLRQHERNALDGIMLGNMRNGPVRVYLQPRQEPSA